MCLYFSGSNQNVWVDLRQTRDTNNDGSACSDLACDSKNLVWSDGTTFAFNDAVFPSVTIESGKWCNGLETGTRNMNSFGCSSGSGLLVACQIDCRPRKYFIA